MTWAIAAGVIDLGFAVFHILFWRLLNWPKTLERSGGVNAAVTQALNVVLIYVLIVYGAALIWTSAHPSRWMLLAGVGFAVLRSILEPVLFGLRNRHTWPLLTGFIVAGVVHAIAAVIATP